MSAESEKICVVCGKSCAGQARTKDPKGRYYHQACFEKAKSAQRRKQREQHQAASDAFAAPPASSSSSSGLDDEGDVMAMLLEDVAASPSAPPVVGMGSSCPSCGHALSHGAVICINCGYNASSGSAVHTAVAGPTSTNVGGKTYWPVVIGVVSLVIVLIDFAFLGFTTFMAVTTGQLRPLAREVIPLLFTVWLLVGAIGVLRRDRKGFARLKAWALWKTILMVVCGGALFVAVLVANRAMTDSLGSEFEGMGDALPIILAISIGWELWWPLFCLIWTHRDAVQEQVKQW